MKNFITDFFDIVEDVFKWAISVVLFTALILSAFAILLVLFVFDMTMVVLVRAIKNRDELTDTMIEELETWVELFKTYFKPYFEKEES